MILKSGCIAYWQTLLIIEMSLCESFYENTFLIVKLSRSEINQFVQADRESFRKYLDRLKNLLSQCPHHGLNQACLCQIIYECIDQQNSIIIESMCQGGFLSNSPSNAWEFLEVLAEKNYAVGDH